MVHAGKICLLPLTFSWFITTVSLKEGKKFAVRFCSAVFTEVDSSKGVSVSLLIHYVFFTSRKLVKRL